MTALRHATSASLLSHLVRAMVHAITALVLTFPLTVPEAMVGAALGAFAGALAGVGLGRSRLRTVAIVLSVLVGSVLFGLVHSGLSSSAGLAGAIGPVTALRLGQVALFSVYAFVVSATLRSLSVRRPPLAVLEVALVGIAFAQLFVAHRHGAINRPFEIADPILSRGGDPTVAFLVVGAIATFVLVLLLVSERSFGRLVYHVAAVLVLLLSVLATTSVMGVPPPPPTGGGLGLRDDESKGEGKNGDKGKGGRRDNEELEFRDNYESDANQVPVAIVLFHDDYSPPSGIYYLRQGAFSEFNGRRLVGSTRKGVDTDIAPGFPVGDSVEVPGAPEAGAHRYTLETTVALLAEHTRPFALETPLSLSPESNHNPARFKRIYRVTSAALTSDFYSLLGLPAGDPKWSEEIWDQYTEAPSDARYGSLAKKIVAERVPAGLENEPIVKALAVASHLSKLGKYSLKSRHASADDPTASFLFGDLTGYCVHFAHAATYLLRSLGLPARVATGYAIPESARRGGSALMVTGSASHAWPEVYLEGVGWVIVDISPETVLDPPPPPPDPDLQRLLAELLRNEKPIPEAGKASVSELAQFFRTIGERLIFVLGGALVLLLLSLVLVKGWRRLEPSFAGEAALPRVLYRAVLDRLSEVGIVRERGESREAFARRIGDVAPSFRPLTHAHVGARFGSARPAGAGLRQLAKAANRELRSAVSFRRRALGALVPWSWLRSR